MIQLIKIIGDLSENYDNLAQNKLLNFLQK